MNQFRLLCTILLPLGGLACTDDTTPDDVVFIDAAPVQGDSRPESFIWDSGGADDGGMMGTMDRGVTPDAAPIRCFREGATLVEDEVGDPIEGLVGLRTDVDYDGDGVGEIMLRRVNSRGVHFDFLSATERALLGTVSVLGATSAQFMPGIDSGGELVTARTMGGQTVFVLTGQRETGETTLHITDTATETEISQADLGLAVGRIQLFGAGATWHALVDRTDGTCAAYRLPAATLAHEWETCRLEPGWDLNQDGLRDIVRTGDTGFAVIDGQILEQIGHDGTANPIAVGFGPHGPVDLRGQGPEVVTAAIEEGGNLVIRYHDPVDLRPLTEGVPVPLNGTFIKARFINVGDQMRLVGEYHRVELKLLGLLEVTDGVRRVNEYGSVTVLDWSVGTDANGDGQRDLRVVAGARQGGFNTPVEYADLLDGLIIHTIDRERSARFDPVWNTTAPPAPADLDGCEGVDHLTMRSGATRDDGQRSTRLVVTSDGSVRFRSDTYEGHVHQVAMADLDGVAPPELIEIRSENADSARLRILRVASPSEAE